MNFIAATTDEILSQLAARLRSQRLAQGLPQSELALMAGLSLGAVRKLESTGQCSLDTFVRVAQALGLIAELDPIFATQPTSIADMQRAAKAKLRRRAPRRLQ